MPLLDHVPCRAKIVLSVNAQNEATTVSHATVRGVWWREQDGGGVSVHHSTELFGRMTKSVEWV